jgi:hypothetical protein
MHNNKHIVKVEMKITAERLLLSVHWLILVIRRFARLKESLICSSIDEDNCRVQGCEHIRKFATDLLEITL